MLPRLLKLPFEHSFFLFGARGTGKSTLLKQIFDPQKCLWIDLLDSEVEDNFARDHGYLTALVNALPENITYIVIDEVQKIPKLLDTVHLLIESTNKKFILTGSSARKLKRGGANLLAGRAFVYNMFPFSFLELGDDFFLDDALNWGLLPKIIALKNKEEKARFLQAYALTYLKEEIWAEHVINKLDPFRKFLEVAAQCSGKIINYSNIASDVGVDDKTVVQYFSILEDTLIGFMLEPFQNSFRKRLSAKPKFYFFDLGVTKALARTLTVPLQSGTSAYGEAFEQFVILECFKLASYFNFEYRFSYLRTKDDVEIDLIVERPGKPLLCIEIKSSKNVREEDLSSFLRITGDLKNSEAVCFSQDEHRKKFKHATVYPWRDGITKFFVTH